MNNNAAFRSEIGLKLKRKCLYKAVKAEMVGASALMTAEMLLDKESPDYVLGFLNGFNHCLELGDCFDVIDREKIGDI